ncbi:GNAT family protein [Pseudoalteromonas distincta]|uniref:GNAT family protein n=1 Tax=Pseudoalteromonas distincta TaxID=77608 RepID=UPI00165EDFD1|nr:GNAT family protein [Pseudoalteromonas distincta]MBD0412090.1 GNAT family N-acetyltransferase [Pseudoalteromonas distincta]
MKIYIKQNDNNIDVFVGDNIGNSPMRLLAEMQSTFSDDKECKIQDIWGGGQNSSHHRKGIGTALVYFYLKHLEEKYGQHCLVTRTEIFNEAGDSADTITNRRNFWRKVGISDNQSVTVYSVLQHFASNNFIPNSTEFTLQKYA